MQISCCALAVKGVDLVVGWVVGFVGWAWFFFFSIKIL